LLVVVAVADLAVQQTVKRLLAVAVAAQVQPFSSG
jgi:hypothetical protein